MELSRRLRDFPAYIFARVGQRITELRAQGLDVIRLDIGSPDMPPAPHILEALHRSADDPTHHSYAGYFGIPEFRQAIADYYARRFNVTLDPDRQVLPLIGSKEGIYNLAFAFVDPGDIVLVPDPGYPTYQAGALLAGGVLYTLPLRAENDFLPDLSAIPVEVARRAKLLWLNYPNNPTTACAPLDFFAEAVEFAHEYDLLLCHDAPYTEVTYDGYVAPSLLQVPGAHEVAIEFNSLSKTYNMAGWRVGMAVGNAMAVSALARLKSNIDSGLPRPVQDAAVAALTGDQSWLVERNAIYRKRREIILAALADVGMPARVPQATLYVWAQVPAGMSSLEFTDALLEEQGVALAPGTAFGPHGEGYVRISVGAPTQRIREAMGRLRAFAEGRRLDTLPVPGTYRVM